jgi:hypothetical protein
MLSAAVPEKMTGSCGTSEIRLRRWESGICWMDCPSIRMRPPSMSWKRRSNWNKVDLPAPDGPTIATVVPAATSNDSRAIAGGTGRDG